MNTPSDSQPCRAADCGCGRGIDRRAFVKLAGIGTAAALAPVAGPFAAEDAEQLVPVDKKLSPHWVKALSARGTPTVYRGAEVEKIGMPVGGLCTGQLYLGGDGKLWHWDIFNHYMGTGDAHYAHPPLPASPLDQGFAVRVETEGKAQVRALSRDGFPGVTFRGEYPVAFVDYRDEHFPVSVALEAFSPFIPLNADDSGLPATVMQFTVKNTSRAAVDVQLAGWLQNAVCLYTGGDGFRRRNRVVRRQGLTFLECTAEAPPEKPSRPPVVFADFEGDDYGPWRVEGRAFGKGPARGQVGAQRLHGYRGRGLVNSWQNSDEAHGKLTSPEFTIERPFISFLIGGGNHPGKTCINLLVDGRVVRTATGKNSDDMEWANWDVRALAGKKARIEILDAESGGWGHIDIDQIEFGDRPVTTPLPGRPDFGSMGLALLGSEPGDSANLSLSEAEIPHGLFTAGKPASDGDGTRSAGQRLRGALGRKLTLKAGEEARASFVLTWCFPTLRLPGFAGVVGRHYARRFKNALAVATYVTENFDRLAGLTRRWHRTWYDSTLPYWLLDRLFANTSILASSTCYRFRDGRFYGWEGVGCCEGTCTHVWHYAHAAARLFPELERSAREMQDLGPAFAADTGLVRFRGEVSGDSYAADGQAGVILRCYREHQMSADDAFLKRNWPRIKKAMAYLIRQDGNDDGLIDNAQPNTLDTAFYGQSSMIGSLYLAALRAAEEMAVEVGDKGFAKRVRAIFESGTKKLAHNLWNGEYFIHRPDPRHPEALKVGTGCFIDQVFGQSWAHQVGLGRILPAERVKEALRSLWKYNWTPNVGPYRAVHKNGRWYAMPGEAGLIMCTWPRGGGEDASGKVNPVFAGYLNECMNGFEYQAAGHMLWEGLVTEGLAVCRAIHERYHAARRNPWNEVECGDHYARSMASYGVFLAACGYEHHGPKQHLGFAPRLSPESFRAAFTTAEGWGTFSQKRDANGQTEVLDIHWGKLRVRTLAFELAPGTKPARVTVTAGGKAVQAAHALRDNRVTVSLSSTIVLPAGSGLEVVIA